MHILLVEPDEDARKRWISKLGLDPSVLTTAATQRAVRNAFTSMPFALAFVRFPLDWTTEPESILPAILGKSHLAIAIADDYRNHAAGACSLGFFDCIDESCSHEQLHAKLEHAEYLNRLEQRLVQAQKLESIGELAAGIAHEINTPIQYVGDNTRFVQDSCGELLEIVSCCQQLVEQSSSGGDLSSITEQLNRYVAQTDIDFLMEEIPTAIRQTLEGVDRVANIVRAMKEFSHPGVSEMLMTDLSKSIANTLMVARNEWKYVAEVKTEFDPNLPLVPCLPGELNQVLLNMIVNAAHAIGECLSKDSDAKGTITIATRASSKHAEICISDTGAGIAPENVSRIFNPFFTTKAAGKGTGQGLAIAHTVIVEKHGGTIDVESALGRGTTFVIRIPLASRCDTETHCPADETIQMACP